MSKKKELAKNTIIIFIGKISTQLITFLLLPLYTSVLVSSDYGIIDLIVTYISLFVSCIMLQLDSAVFRFLIDARKDEKEKSSIISTGTYVVILQIFVFLIFFLIANTIFTIKYSYFIAFNIISSIFLSMMLQIVRGLGDNKNYSIASVINGVSLVVLNILFLVILNFGAIGLLLSMLISNILSGLFVFIFNKIYLYTKFKYVDKKIAFKLLKYSLPLVPNGIIWWIINVSDRTIITLFINSSANGIYAISNKFSGVYITLYNIFNLSWTESATVHINDDDKEQFFSDTINTMFNFFGCLCIGVIASMPFVFPIMINSQYKDAYIYIPFLMLGSFFNVLVGLISVVYVAKKMTKKIAITSLLSGIINILINIIFVKKIGIWASVISTIIAFATMSVFRYFDVKKYINIKLKLTNLSYLSVAYIFVVLCYYSKSYILYSFSLMFIFVLSIILNKNIIITSINFIKEKILRRCKNE